MDIRDDATRDGVRECSGLLATPTATVPWTLWLPSEGGLARQLVLIGHGASGDKQEGYVVALGRILARRGCAALAIDGPVHGERRMQATSEFSSPFLDFAARWSSDEGMTDAMINDWRRTLDATLASGLVARDAVVGYWGLSMGTILGLPLVAAESRIRACVLGLMGLTGPTKDRIAHDAAQIDIPTMFLMQWDDQLFHRPDVLSLFGELGSTDKVLVATPGNHGDVTPENYQGSAEFLLKRLGGAR